jgi:hypothetical protein
MAVLPNNTKEAFRDIKLAIGDHISNIDNIGKVWRRMRYADNLNQWLELAAVEKVAGVEVVRVVFIYLAGFTIEKAEFRQRKITATFSIEVIQGFEEGTDQDNSTDFFEGTLGDLEEAFSNDYALGFTDAASQPVENTPFAAAPGENEGKPLYVDGVLSHRTIGSINVLFRLC